jgi:hypothetical protein
MVTMSVGNYLLVLFVTGAFGVMLGACSLGLTLMIAKGLPKKRRPQRFKIPVQNMNTAFVGRRT